MNDVIHVPQAGKITGGKLRLGKMVLVKGKPTLKLTNTRIPLGDGIELASEMSSAGVVWLSVTAAAAKRVGWAHPANQPEPSRADLDRLCGIVGNQAYGQQEQVDAINKIGAIDPALGQRLALANQWLFDGR